MKIAIIGAGVSGLSCAHELALENEVTVFHDRGLLETTSSIATAIWHVYLVDPNDRQNLTWSEVTLRRLMRLAEHEPVAGVELVHGVELYRTSPCEKPSWANVALDFVMLDEETIDRLYPGAKWGYTLRAPAVNMHRYLPWLHEKCIQAGAIFVERSVTADELDGGLEGFDLIVNCAGMAATALVQDESLFGLRGQYFVLAPGRTMPEFYIGDDQHPDGMAYLIPRDGEILIGGTEEPIDNPELSLTVEDLARRAAEFCSDDLGDAQFIRKVVGVRPCRRDGHIRFGHDETNPRLFHNYGHGGSGFSLSWGCAESVAARVRHLSAVST